MPADSCVVTYGHPVRPKLPTHDSLRSLCVPPG